MTETGTLVPVRIVSLIPTNINFVKAEELRANEFLSKFLNVVLIVAVQN